METPVITQVQLRIDTEVLAALIRSCVPLYLVDARTLKPGDRYIPGATFLSPNASDETIAQAVPDKDALIVTYCGGPKCSLSSQLAEHLRGMGYHNVLENPDGFEGWFESGRQTEIK